MAAIDAARKRVFDELNGKLCRDKLSNRFASLWEELRQKADTCNNVATLQNIKVEADALKIRNLNEIEEMESRMQAAQAAAQAATEAAQKVPEKTAAPTSTASAATGNSAAPQPPVKAPVAPTPKVERKKTISIKTVTSQYSWQIRSEADIDKYLQELRSKLVSVLEEDTTVNIEF